MLPIRTILHPTDFSESSNFAFRLACSLARDYSVRLLVLHVGRQPIVTPVTGIIPPEPVQYEEELTAQLHKLQAENPKVPVESRLIFGADPATEILRLAQQTKSDLIVMGTHGRTGLGRLLMGSVAEQVVRHAPCPVLTVKTPFPQPPPASVPVLEEAEEPLEAAKT